MTSRRQRLQQRLPRTPLGLLAVATVAVGACGGSRGSGDGTTAAPPAIVHVHGLGINPADGSLQVATHTGTFRIADDGSVKRVDATAQDTMGFTVVGPDRFLGSGHPDAAGFRQGKPPRLGLIESTDGGTTWVSRSLSGEVDFHALATSQGTTYGWDSSTSRLLASTDNVRWETRATLPLSGLAVDPGNAERLVAGGAEATLRSDDGGRTWQPSGAAPRLASLSWAPGGTLWGVDGAGGLHRSTDAGATWQAAGRVVGEPEALLATDDRVIVAVATADGRTAITESSDAGRTWRLRYESPT